MNLDLEGIRKEFEVAVHGLNDHLTPRVRDKIGEALVAKLAKHRLQGASDVQFLSLIPSIKRLCSSFEFVFDEDWGLTISCHDQDGARARTLLNVGSTWFSRIDVDEFLSASAT